MAENERKAALISSLERSRSEIASTAHALRQDLDVAAHVRRSFARNPAIWIGATSLAGLILVRILWPKPKIVTQRRPGKKEAELEEVGKAGLALSALKIAFDIARPVLIPWATRLFVERFSPDQNRTPPPR
jgi:hypothetical protein